MVIGDLSNPVGAVTQPAAQAFPEHQRPLKAPANTGGIPDGPPHQVSVGGGGCRYGRRSVRLCPCAPERDNVATQLALASTHPIVAPLSPSPSSPTGFQPLAFTAISESQFWVLGTIGCTATRCAPHILHTVNSGEPFQGVPAPAAVSMYGMPTTSDHVAVFDMRFADASDGWLFGKQLWSTHDGGDRWQRVDIGPDAQVAQLEPGAGGLVYAVFQDCPSTIMPCTYRVARSQVASGTWSTITPPSTPAGPVVLGVHGNTLWLMYFGGSTGVEWISRDDGTTFSQGGMPCEPDLEGNYDPVSTSVISAFCPTGNSGGTWVSTNSGATFAAAGPFGGQFTNEAIVAALSADHAFVISLAMGALQTTDRGATYHPVAQLTGAQWGGFTNSEVGYVITENAAGGYELWRTSDAGGVWSPVSLA